METLDSLTSDTLALRALADAYALHVDNRDYDAFAGLFTADAVLRIVQDGSDGSFAFTGHAELPDAARPVEQYLTTLHVMGNHITQVDGDTGTGEVYCLAHHLRAVDGTDAEDLVMAIRYSDAYARTTDGWRFATRQVRILWTERRPASRAPLGF